MSGISDFAALKQVDVELTEHFGDIDNAAPVVGVKRRTSRRRAKRNNRHQSAANAFADPTAAETLALESLLSRRKSSRSQVLNAEQCFAHFQQPQEFDRVFSESCLCLLDLSECVLTRHTRSVNRFRKSSSMPHGPPLGSAVRIAPRTVDADMLTRLSPNTDAERFGDQQCCRTSTPRNVSSIRSNQQFDAHSTVRGDLVSNDYDDRFVHDVDDDGDDDYGDGGNGDGDGVGCIRGDATFQDHAHKSAQSALAGGGVPYMLDNQETQLRLRCFAALWYQITCGSETFGSIVRASNRLRGDRVDVIAVAFVFRFSVLRSIGFAKLHDRFEAFRERTDNLLMLNHMNNCSASDHGLCTLRSPGDITLTTSVDLRRQCVRVVLQEISRMNARQSMDSAVANEVYSMLVNMSAALQKDLRECWLSEIALSASLLEYTRNLYHRVAGTARNLRRIPNLGSSYFRSHAIQLYALMFVRSFEVARQVAVSVEQMLFDHQLSNMLALLAGRNADTHSSSMQNAAANTPAVPDVCVTLQGLQEGVGGTGKPAVAIARGLAEQPLDHEASILDEEHEQLDRLVENDQDNLTQCKVRSFLMGYGYYLNGKRDTKRLVSRAITNSGIDFDADTDCAELLELNETILNIYSTLKMLYYDEPTLRLQRFVASVEHQLSQTLKHAGGRSNERVRMKSREQMHRTLDICSGGGISSNAANNEQTARANGPAGNVVVGGSGGHGVHGNCAAGNNSSRNNGSSNGTGPVTNSIHTSTAAAASTNASATTPSATLVDSHPTNLFEFEFLVRQLRAILLSSSAKSTSSGIRRSDSLDCEQLRFMLQRDGGVLIPNDEPGDANQLIDAMERDAMHLNEQNFQLNERFWEDCEHWVFAKYDQYKFTYAYALMSHLHDLTALRKVRETIAFYTQLLSLKVYRLIFRREKITKRTRRNTVIQLPNPATYPDGFLAATHADRDDNRRRPNKRPRPADRQNQPHNVKRRRTSDNSNTDADHNDRAEEDYGDTDGDNGYAFDNGYAGDNVDDNDEYSERDFDEADDYVDGDQAECDTADDDVYPENLASIYRTVNDTLQNREARDQNIRRTLQSIDALTQAVASDRSRVSGDRAGSDRAGAARTSVARTANAVAVSAGTRGDVDTGSATDTAAGGAAATPATASARSTAPFATAAPTSVVTVSPRESLVPTTTNPFSPHTVNANGDLARANLTVATANGGISSEAGRRSDDLRGTLAGRRGRYDETAYEEIYDNADEHDDRANDDANDDANDEYQCVRICGRNLDKFVRRVKRPPNNTGKRPRLYD